MLCVSNRLAGLPKYFKMCAVHIPSSNGYPCFPLIFYLRNLNAIWTMTLWHLVTIRKCLQQCMCSEHSLGIIVAWSWNIWNALTVVHSVIAGCSGGSCFLTSTVHTNI